MICFHTEIERKYKIRDVVGLLMVVVCVCVGGGGGDKGYVGFSC